MHISLALGVEAAQGEISNWIYSCVKLCRSQLFQGPPSNEVA